MGNEVNASKGICMKLNIDKNDKTPIHRQIIDQVCFMIDSGVLRGGDKLPTERALSERYGVSRGTVNTAYLELSRMGKILTIQGSGTYVTKVHTDVEQGYVRSQIDVLLHAAASVGISDDKVLALLDQEIRRRRRGFTQVHAAWIGCCVEVLRMTEHTLLGVPLVHITSFHIDEVLKNPKLLDDDFDLIVTTEYPYDALLHAVPMQADKIVRVTLSLDEESAFALSSIVKGRQALMYGVERLFVDTVRQKLDLSTNLDNCLYFAKNAPGISKALESSEVLILPEKSLLYDQEELLQAAREFALKGKEVLYISYHVDRGSVIHFESVVKQCWIEKCRTGITNQAETPEYHKGETKKRQENRF